MHRVDALGATEEGRFTEGDPVVPIPPTEVPATWLNMVQDELEGVLSAAGMERDKQKNTQVAEAIKALIQDGRVDLTPILQALELHERTTLAHGAHGFAPGADGSVLTSRGGEAEWEAPFRPAIYELGEFYSFRHPTLRPGFQPAQGGLLVNAATLYPEAWAYLQTTEGQKLCKTEAEWQVMTTAIWHTNADGTTVGWNGIGGAPFYAPNLATGALRLPDLRGMYAEAAGFDSLGVGGVHGDGMRNITGTTAGGLSSLPAGAFVLSAGGTKMQDTLMGGTYVFNANYFDPSRVVPIAAKNQPRAWGALACVYLGQPVS